MAKYTVKGYYEYSCFDKVYIEVEAESAEDALLMAKNTPDMFEKDYKNIDIGEGEFINFDEWEVLND